MSILLAHFVCFLTAVDMSRIVAGSKMNFKGGVREYRLYSTWL